MDQLSGIHRDARLAKQAHAIRSRADLERWKNRSTRRLRFILLSYVIGGLSFAAFGPLIGLIETIKANALPSAADMVTGVKAALTLGFCCGGPLVLLPCTVLVTGGVSKYKQLMDVLNQEYRVCHVCGSVALFDDQYVHPSKGYSHTAADLVPHMNIIQDDTMTHVICDSCLAKVSRDEQDLSPLSVKEIRHS